MYSFKLYIKVSMNSIVVVIDICKKHKQRYKTYIFDSSTRLSYKKK